MSEAQKAKYRNNITVEIVLHLYEVECPKCQKSFIYRKHPEWKFPIRAIGCIYCACVFNVDWSETIDK